MKESLFCTIITADYFHYALALHDSLRTYNSEVQFAVYISKGSLSSEQENEFQKRKNFSIYTIADFELDSLAHDLKKKYNSLYHDAYRWGMKPVLVGFLLQNYEKVIYLDSDLYFFDSYNFLFTELDSCNILLSPHWRSSDPNVEYRNFVHNFRDGLFNAGFFGASIGGEAALNWWAKMILFRCEVDRDNGFYVDQRYLDLMPILYDGVKILKHKGCNVGNWNMVECKRVLSNQNEVLINNKYPIVFIHFTNSMFKGIYNQNDTILLPFLEIYRENLLRYSRIDVIEEFFRSGQFIKPRSEADFRSSSSKKVENKYSKVYKNLKLKKAIQVFQKIKKFRKS